MIISLFPSKLTFPHVRVVVGSKSFSFKATSSPILQEVKKHSVQAVQKTCLEKGVQFNLKILSLSTSRRNTFIGSLSGLTGDVKACKLLAPFRAIFTHGSEFRLREFTLLSV